MLKFLKHSKRIGKKALTQYLLLAYVLIVLNTSYFAYLSFNSCVERKGLEMEAVTYKIESKFLGIFDYTESVLSDLGRKISVAGVNKEIILKDLKSFQGRGDYYNIIRDLLSEGMFFWIDNNKRMLMSSEYGLFKIPFDLSKRDYLEQTKLNPWNLYTGAVVVGAASGQQIIPIGMGVSNKQGQHLGTIAVGYIVPVLAKKLMRISLRQEVDLAVLDKDNQVVVESIPELFSNDKTLSKNLQNLHDETEVQVVKDFDLFKPDSNYVVSRGMEQYPYKILISAPNKEIRDEAFKEIKPQLVGFLIVTIFFATLLFFVRGVLKE